MRSKCGAKSVSAVPPAQVHAWSLRSLPDGTKTATNPLSAARSLPSSSLSIYLPHLFTSTRNPQASSKDALTHSPSVQTCPRATTVKIPSPASQQHLSTPSPALPLEVDLNFSTALSFRSSSLPTTATIPAQDFPVFTTDSTQSPWLPSSSSSLPGPPAHQQSQASNHFPPPQQDFVLFDTPAKRPRSQHSRPATQPSLSGGQQHHQLNSSASPTLQNQRVAQIIQATGHNASSPAFSNRFSSSTAQNPFYASSSAPSSTVALNQARPPVPLFSAQSTGSIPQTAGKMNLEDLQSLDDFTGFGGGAATSYSSPGMPTVFDLTASASSSTSNMGTVSPQDLLLHESFMSAPNSTALTSLTSPSLYNGSPEYSDSYDVSPAFGTNDFDAGDPQNWFPLFPDGNATKQQLPQQQQQQPAVADHSPASKSDDLDPVEPAPSSRRKSGTSPPSGKHSSVSGVNSRRRDKPLPPIIVDDPHDTVAMKRARNTLAARKSRERKAQKLEELEEEIAKLTAERDHWKALAESRH